ncbi:MAG: efflux RND transporter periplasmic adaptor subunit [Candidatus Eremiobacteraeota bacterium]|nr:efflux RND transporter periplasmic adaptor subunit [Candidatus Eremiobacteraeota bacterium]MCW5866119.1 efflux RND transporter periplasmic adaptor subunit [Candidatus Eremiobacteraeota bacterium]
MKIYLAIGLLLVGCGVGPRPEKKKEARVPVVAVAFPKLQKRGESREYTGTVESLTQVAVVPQVAGQLEAVYVSVGDPVHRDQLLATVDDSQLEAQVQQAQAQASAAQAGTMSALANLAAARDQTRQLQQAVDQARSQVLQAEAQLAKAQTQTNLARRNLERVREVAAQDLIARQVVDQTEAAFESAQADERSSRAQLNSTHRQLDQARLRASGSLEQEQSAQAQVASAQAQAQSLQSALRAVEVRRNYCKVRSPIDGVVIARSLDPGAYVTPGGSTSVVLVASLKQLRVAFQLSEADLQLIRAGQKVKISLDALAGVPQKGEVQRLSGGLDPTTRTLRVEVKLIQPDERLRPGMLARLRVQGTASEALTLPIQGVVTKGDKQFAYVVGEDNVISRRALQIGSLEGDIAVIDGGLTVKDKVVVRGVDLVQEGKPVRPVPLSQ